MIRGKRNAMCLYNHSILREKIKGIFSQTRANRHTCMRGYDMKLSLVLNYHHHQSSFMAAPQCLRSLRRASPLKKFSSFSSSVVSSKWEGGVSMVQGASRGIGLEFVKQLLENKGNGHVIATCRDPDKAVGLLDLKNEYADRLDILQLDLTTESTIKDTASVVQQKYGSLNLLINASGILSIPDSLQPEKTLNKLQKSSLLLSYEVNAIGPILVIKVGGRSGSKKDFAVVASLSARVGSIGDNRLGGWHAYRASKAALNQLTKTVSVEFAQKKDPIICLLLHPGTVDTDLSRPFQANVPEGKLFTKEYSVQKLLSVIEDATRNDNGKFFAWDGQEIPW